MAAAILGSFVGLGAVRLESPEAVGWLEGWGSYDAVGLPWLASAWISEMFLTRVLMRSSERRLRRASLWLLAIGLPLISWIVVVAASEMVPSAWAAVIVGHFVVASMPLLAASLALHRIEKRAP